MERHKKQTTSKSKSSEISSVAGARQYALRLLTGRDYSVARLKQKLRDRCFAEPDLEAAVSALELEGWINDGRFARRFAESAMESGRYYGSRLCLELKRRGIPGAVVSKTLDEIMGERNEDGDALSMLKRRFSEFSFSLAGDGEKRRVFGFLCRRGFSAAVALRAMKAEES